MFQIPVYRTIKELRKRLDEEFFFPYEFSIFKGIVALKNYSDPMEVTRKTLDGFPWIESRGLCYIYDVKHVFDPNWIYTTAVDPTGKNPTIRFMVTIKVLTKAIWKLWHGKIPDWDHRIYKIFPMIIGYYSDKGSSIVHGHDVYIDDDDTWVVVDDNEYSWRARLHIREMIDQRKAIEQKHISTYMAAASRTRWNASIFKTFCSAGSHKYLATPHKASVSQWLKKKKRQVNWHHKNL